MAFQCRKDPAAAVVVAKRNPKANTRKRMVCQAEPKIIIMLKCTNCVLKLNFHRTVFPSLPERVACEKYN